jgi:phage terminase small subunit
MSLTPKQAFFVKEYLIDLNATQAAIRAGYSPKTANEQASRLLANVNVASVVQEEMDKRAKRTEIDADYVLTGIRNVTETVAKEGEGFNPQAALKGYELMGKHLKLFTDKVEHSGGLTVVKVSDTDERI